MDFRRVRVTAFGRLRDLDTGQDALPRLVVVQGVNEAGKSTFFQFLTSLLYGFYPASRDAHPYTPWSGGDAAGEAEIALGDGEVVEVQRRLLATPAGSLVRDGSREDIRNRTLPFAEHVPLAVFRQVFALTLGELARLEGESWTRVQDRLVAGMGASDVLPVREAAEALERDAGELWRPNRRGNQAVRDLRERLRELRLRRRTAADNDRRLRTLAGDRHGITEELREAREEREACRLYVERFRALLPIRDQLHRIEALEEEAGDPGELEGVPAEPAARLEELEARLARVDARLRELREESEEPRELLDREPPDGGRLVERAAEVRSLVSRVAGLEPERVRRGQLEQEIRDLGRRAETAGVELFDGPLDNEAQGRLRAVPVGELRASLQRLADATEALRIAEAAATAGDRAGSTRTPAAIVAALAGIVGVVLGVAGGGVAWGIVGALLLGVGGAVLALSATEARRRAGRRDDESRRLADARRLRRQAAEAPSALLTGLPVRPALLESGSTELAGRIQRLQEILRDREDRALALAALSARLEGVAGELREMAATTGRDLPGDPGAASHTLERILREAESHQDAVRHARRDMERIERERRRLEAERADVAREREGLLARLSRLGDGDTGLGMTRARERVQTRERAAQLRDEMARAHPDLDEIRDRIGDAEEAGEDWAVDDEAIARRRARELELTQRIEELGRRLEGIEKDMDYLRRGDTADAVEGEILAVEARLAEAIRERDRRWVVAAVLREADRRFREEHQPDVLRQAGRYLDTITGGRYERILVGEEGDGTFLLRGPDYPMPMEVAEPVSTGTREQVYLALRLAVLDHLDRTGERLPLFMDEAFVNWDADRRERTFSLLEEVARTRQVFVFTCHEPMARNLAARGARLVSLGRDS